MQVCPNCGEENPPRFRLCGYCGTPLAPALPAQEERRIVTIVFSDLKGSTTLGERLDPEAVREVMSRYFDAMTAVLQRHGGTIEKFIGDAIMAVFGLPRIHEDDALRAVRAASETRQALAELNRDLDRQYGVTLTNRTGVNTGEVVTGDPTTGQRLVTGDTVNVAARLEQAAPASEVLLGELTYRLVRGAVEVEAVAPLELKGKAEPVPAYRLITVRGGDAFVRRLDAPLVGREREMAELRHAFAEARDARECHAVTLVAEAGAGKSRLVKEFVQGVADEGLVLRGRCLPYGEGITFWPLVEVVREAAGIGPDEEADLAARKVWKIAADPAVAQRVTAAVGLSQENFPVPELFWGARKLLETLAAPRPVCLVIDDIHWAQPTFLDLLEHLVSTVEEAPLLLLATSRHELLETRSEWGQGPRSVRLALAPLTEGDARQIVSHLLGETRLSDEVHARIAGAAEGNPLYVEQMLSMLMDSGALHLVDGRWEPTRELTALDVPPTIQALLAARLGQLGREERKVLEPAAVVGLEFPQAAVEALVPEVLAPAVPVHLDAMVRKQLVQPHPSTIVGEEGFRFGHALIRDAAYGGLLKRARATLHVQFVEWADRVNAERDRASEYEEILGYHLEQAYHYLTDLGPLDDRGREIGRAGSQRLAAAGGRAFARGDMPAAANLLQRAAALLPERDPARLRLSCDLGEALTELGRFDDARTHLDQAVAAAAEAGDERLAAEARLTLLLVERYAGATKGWAQRTEAETRASIPVLDAHGDDRGLMKAYRLLTWVHGPAGRYAESAAAAERVIEHARRSGDRRQEARGAVIYAMNALSGPTRVREAIERCREIVRQVEGDRRTLGLVLCCLAQLHGMDGDFERGRELYRQARAMLEDIGAGVLASSTALNSWWVEYLAGDYDAAERELRRDYAALEGMGEHYFLSTIAAALGRVLLAQGRREEADAATDTALRLADDDDLVSLALARGAQARLLAGRGDVERARALAGEVVELVRPSQNPTLQAYALLDYADVVRRGGDPAAADAALRDALQLFAAKGSRVEVDRVEAMLNASTAV